MELWWIDGGFDGLLTWCGTNHPSILIHFACFTPLTCLAASIASYPTFVYPFPQLLAIIDFALRLLINKSMSFMVLFSQL